MLLYNAKSFSQVTVSIYTPTSKVLEFALFCALPTFNIGH